MSHKKVFFMPFDPVKSPAAFKEYGNTPTGFNKNQAMIDHELAKGNVATQVWFTGTETAPFAPILSAAAIWTVAGGTAQRES